MSPKSPRRRLVRRVARAALLCAALGLLSAPGVAWWFALTLRAENDLVSGVSVDLSSQASPFDFQIINIYGMVRCGFTRTELREGRGPNRSFDRVIASRAVVGLKEQAKDWVGPAGDESPGWSGPVALPPDDGSRYTMWSVRAAGWPCLCLCSRTSVDSLSKRSISGSLPVLDSSHYRVRAPSSDPELGAVPLIPMWPGLAIDAALFSAAWAALLFLPPHVYRRLRTSRRVRLGWCVACAYDLKGQGGLCPECGAAALSNTPA